MVTTLLAGLLALPFAAAGSGGDGEPEGFLAAPESGKGAGVLVLHPWWGLNEDVKAFCRRLADAGFTAFAPDLFHGRTAANPQDAEALVKEHDAKAAQLMAEISKAAKFLGERTGKKEVAVVGFSFGAYYALAFSNEEPDRVPAVVVFYGTGQEDFSRSKAAYLGHFAEDDDYEPKESVEALAKLLGDAGRPATIHTYPGTGHWFFEPSVKQAYNQGAADLAWDRTMEFLRKRLD